MVLPDPQYQLCYDMLGWEVSYTMCCDNYTLLGPIVLLLAQGCVFVIYLPGFCGCLTPGIDVQGVAGQQVEDEIAIINTLSPLLQAEAPWDPTLHVRGNLSK